MQTAAAECHPRALLIEQTYHQWQQP